MAGMAENMVILFKKQFVPKIINKQKTMTRRLWNTGRVKVGKIYQARTNRFEEPFAYLRITGVCQERLGHISGKDVRAEGFDNLDEFIKVWKAINGSYDPNAMVYAISFEIVNKSLYIAQSNS